MTFAATRHIFWALSVSKAVRALPQIPPGQHSPRPSSLLSLSKNLFPALGLRPRNSQFPLDKFLAKPVGSMSNQNCCKGFRFKENVENHRHGGIEAG